MRKPRLDQVAKVRDAQQHDDDDARDQQPIFDRALRAKAPISASGDQAVIGLWRQVAFKLSRLSAGCELVDRRNDVVSELRRQQS
jgi:hypothetical protein